ncbi:hypothetical protein K443DRAFT_3714 [Laccaria amethystina LaAM-08-1]|uniref:CCHC-type domain-containing protein n=1 Tax=Laccaria amethystina LaAM-08-1 TaxID=1095629 RepID=A0A0C9XVT6_9AGAR|nr:hypothetical protein K443DRAFT_3714 [Laccaria amethystina LaAM-08-1]
MDIDRLTVNERDQYMKEGKCFRCGKTGHVSRDHATNPALNAEIGNSSNFRKPGTPYKAIMPAPNKVNYATNKVRSIMMGLNNEELEKVKIAFIESQDKKPEEPLASIEEYESEDEENQKGFYVPGSDSKSMHVKTRIINGEKSVEMKALIDSGAQGNFMDEEFAKKHRIPIVRLKKEIRVSNVDESPNKSGPIRFETRLPMKIDGKTIST